MFTDRYFGKRRSTKKSQQPASISTPEIQEPNNQVDSPTPTGSPIDDYARTHSLSTGEVWEQVRRGALAARTQSGRVYIHETELSFKPESVPATQHPNDSELPPLDLSPSPSEAEISRIGASLAAETPSNFLSANSSYTATYSPELALLLDHLSLAKEENREILKLTQDSLRKVTDLSDRLVEMKDAVIDAQNAQISALKEQLQERERAVQKLQQQNEDLEMLARAALQDPHAN